MRCSRTAILDLYSAFSSSDRTSFAKSCLFCSMSRSFCSMSSAICPTRTEITSPGSAALSLASSCEVNCCSVTSVTQRKKSPFFIGNRKFWKLQAKNHSTANKMKSALAQLVEPFMPTEGVPKRKEYLNSCENLAVFGAFVRTGPNIHTCPDGP